MRIKSYMVISTVMSFLPVFRNNSNGEKEKGDEEKKSDTIKSGDVSGLKFRSIGPAFTSGRIADFAVNPKNHSEYYVATASGHIWKTVNNGTTFQSDISTIMELIPLDALQWIQTIQMYYGQVQVKITTSVHLGYGDGVYKSVDGGKSWKNMGLKESRQIGMIAIDPRNTDVVYVAAEGSAWGPGGERGLYKTIDGGENWEKVLEISEHTGINNVVLHPCNPDIIFASSEQRRRHVLTKIGGGPESALYKSTDGGKNFRKLTSGIPGVDKGGMGIAISPVDPNVWYVIIEAAKR